MISYWYETLILRLFPNFTYIACEGAGVIKSQDKHTCVVQLTTFHSRDKGLGIEEGKGEQAGKTDVTGEVTQTMDNSSKRKHSFKFLLIF